MAKAGARYTWPATAMAGAGGSPPPLAGLADDTTAVAAAGMDAAALL